MGIKGPITAGLLLFGAITLLPSMVVAHRPIFVELPNNRQEDAQPIPNPAVSWAIYAELGPNEVHWYWFDVPPAGQEIFVQMTVPNRSGHRGFDPWFALVGEAFPAQQGLPFALPRGMGADVAAGAGAEDFFEPFTQTRYLLRQEYRRNLAGGSYYIAVYHPQGKQGKYALTVGEQEDWDWHDLLRFPLIWLRVRWWYSPAQTVAVIAVMAALAAALVWLIFRRIRQ